MLRNGPMLKTVAPAAIAIHTAVFRPAITNPKRPSAYAKRPGVEFRGLYSKSARTKDWMLVELKWTCMASTRFSRSSLRSAMGWEPFDTDRTSLNASLSLNSSADMAGRVGVSRLAFAIKGRLTTAATNTDSAIKRMAAV